jgi:hypothetical protein
VAYEAIYHIRCPLTVWEEKLRVLAGQGFNGSETFMGRLLHNLMFIENQPEIFFTTMYIAMLVIVVQGLIMYPPRMWRLRKQPEAAPAPAPAPAAETVVPQPVVA